MADAPQNADAFSPYVAKCLKIINFSGPVKILDMPCGAGRNAFWLGRLGHEIVTADLDGSRVFGVAVNARQQTAGAIFSVICDAEKPLPFADASFDLVLIVHYVSADLLTRVHQVLKPDGHLIYETFGLQGRNALALPQAGETASILEPWFRLRDYKERGPKGREQQAVAVKLLGQKL